jgi:hypothetical protein
MSMIHSRAVPLGCSEAEIDGSAKLSTVLSTATSSTGSMRNDESGPLPRSRSGTCVGCTLE